MKTHHYENHLRTRDAKFKLIGKRKLLQRNRLSKTGPSHPNPSSSFFSVATVCSPETVVLWGRVALTAVSMLGSNDCVKKRKQISPGVFAATPGLVFGGRSCAHLVRRDTVAMSKTRFSLSSVTHLAGTVSEYYHRGRASPQRGGKRSLGMIWGCVKERPCKRAAHPWFEARA